MSSDVTPADSGVYIHVLALAIAPEWHRRDQRSRSIDLATFSDALDAADEDGVKTLTYSSIGLQPGVDVLLWRTAASVDALERAAAKVLCAGLGTWTKVTNALIGRTAPSQYTSKPTEQESGLTADGDGRYLVVYPFTKSSDWYLLSREARQGVMNEHMRVGRGYPQVRQALAYSFGLDDQDFIVAYETDDLPGFADLVRELRGTESRRSTVRDTPILLGLRRPTTELAALLGVSA